LPGSLISIMGSSRQTGARRFSGEIMKKLKTRWFVSGETKLKIKVEGG